MTLKAFHRFALSVRDQVCGSRSVGEHNGSGCQLRPARASRPERDSLGAERRWARELVTPKPTKWKHGRPEEFLSNPAVLRLDGRASEGARAVQRARKGEQPTLFVVGIRSAPDMGRRLFRGSVERRYSTLLCRVQARVEGLPDGPV